MTIQAVDPRMVHPAAQKGCEDIVFFPDLPIRVVDIRGIGNHQRVMIQKGFTGCKITRQFGAPGMTRSTGVKHLIRVTLAKRHFGWTFSRWRIAIKLDMLFQWTMTGFTPNGHFRHGGMIAVG